jgi:hypothetical protein
MSYHPFIPINVAHLLPVLNSKLINLLKSLTHYDWQKQTIAKLWTVKDVAAHLLDTNLRTISMLRDNHFGEKADINSHQDLVDFLNRLNADWAKAMKRVSPQMIIALHEATGQAFCDYLMSLNPFDKAVLAVDWAGEAESKNWMAVAREYTEKWLHQQQIRDAVQQPGLMTRELFYPFMNIFMFALPHTYRSVTAAEGTIVKVTITTDIGGSWYLLQTGGKWKLTNEPVTTTATEIIIDPDTAWKLFSKSLRPEQVKDKIKIDGDKVLGETALSMISVMA